MLATIITITTFNTLLFGHVQVQLWQVKHHFPKFYFVCFVSVLVHKVTRRVIIQKNGLDLFSLQSRDGGIFKANSMLKINKVVLCCQVHAVVGVLSDDTDPMVTVMKLEKAPQESYADIGGLDQQIQEIKVYLNCHRAALRTQRQPNKAMCESSEAQ